MSVLCFSLVPESPRWLLARGRFGKAENIIRKICAVNEKPMPDNLIATLTEKAVCIQPVQTTVFLEILT